MFESYELVNRSVDFNGYPLLGFLLFTNTNSYGHLFLYDTNRSTHSYVSSNFSNYLYLSYPFKSDYALCNLTNSGTILF